MHFECPHCRKTFSKKKSLKQHVRDKHDTDDSLIQLLTSNQHREKEFGTKEKKPLNSIESSLREPIIVRMDDLLNEVSGFKCPRCGCEKAVYSKSHSPLYSKRSNLIIKCSKCGKGFRDSDF